MILARKLRSAVRLFRHEGLSTLAQSAWDQSRGYVEANSILPQSEGKRAALLTRIFNSRAEFSFVRFDEADVRACRSDLLLPYLRRQFFDAAAAFAEGEPLADAEIVLLADALFRRWEFGRIDRQLADWRPRLAPTKFGALVGQMSRRVALRLGRLSEAAEGLAESGGDAAECLLRAEILDAQGRLAEAGAAFEQAVRRDSSDPLVRLGYAFHLLKVGRTWEGLENWGLADRIMGSYPLRRRRRRGAGGDQGGRRGVVGLGHGLGDMIQLSRFLVPLRAAYPDAVLLGSVPRPLVGLMRASFPTVDFVPSDELDPPYDLYIPSLQLPLVLESRSLQPTTTYIRLAAAERRLPPGGRPRIGVCWRGHPRQYESTRSIAIETFARLFADRSLDFVVLLNSLTPAEIGFLDGVPNVSRPPIGDFVELGALVSECDLVVSVDTAVTHVAAAAGRPTLLLSRPDACWRWGPSGPRTPWYDTVEVIRHPGDMDWEHVLAQASRRLADLAEPLAATG